MRSISLSSDGSIIAIGADHNDDNGSQSGHVRVFQNVDDDWVQLGSDIDGEATDDQSGRSVSISSDGSIVAIGAWQNNGNGINSGHVRVYQWLEPYSAGTKYELASIRDYEGNLHAGASDSVKDQYKHQGQADLDGDGTKEDIFTNDESGRWASVGSARDFDNYGSGGNTRVVGIYNDPLVASGEVEAGSDHDSQTRFQNDLLADNLSLGVGGDFDSDGTD